MTTDESKHNSSSPDVPRGTSEEDPSLGLRAMLNVSAWPTSLQDYATALEDGLEHFLGSLESGGMRLARMYQLKCYDVMSEMVRDASKSNPYADVQTRERGLDHVDGVPTRSVPAAFANTRTQPARTHQEKVMVAALLRPQVRSPRRRSRMRGRRR